MRNQTPRGRGRTHLRDMTVDAPRGPYRILVAARVSARLGCLVAEADVRPRPQPRPHALRLAL